MDVLQDSVRFISTEMPRICPNCNSTYVNKSGFRTVKNDIKRQRYCCTQCHKKFVLGENGFGNVSSDPKIISESLNLVMSGMSYRNVARHIEVAHDVKITHASVYQWIKKYTRIIKEYVESVHPKIHSDVWSVDEMALNVKSTQKTGIGFYDWLWIIVDPATRFIIATEVSKKREIKDARKIISTGKKNVFANPSYVITDSLHSYSKAIRKELDSKQTAHVRTKALKDEFANRPIERIHNEMRENLSARRGLGNDASSQQFMELFKINHNFVRPHQSLGKTPSEAAGIDLDLGVDKYRSLIQKASKKDTFVSGLMKRIKYVNINNNGERIRVTQKGWLDKKVWREINDILSLYGFEWDSNDGRGFWACMT